jgi:hypothetical protein
MKVFSVWIKGIDGALRLRLDGLENAKWLLSRLRLMLEPPQPIPAADLLSDQNGKKRRLSFEYAARSA